MWNTANPEDWLREHAPYHDCHLVVKIGERGSLVCEARTARLIEVPALAAEVVDTTGAGDAYCGGFVAGLVAGCPLNHCAAMATVAASYVVEACGALATCRPTLDERDARLARVLGALRSWSS